jgi:hypothetical protein
MRRHRSALLVAFFVATPDYAKLIGHFISPVDNVFDLRLNLESACDESHPHLADIFLADDLAASSDEPDIGAVFYGPKSVFVSLHDDT